MLWDFEGCLQEASYSQEVQSTAEDSKGFEVEIQESRLVLWSATPQKQVSE